MEKTEYRFPLLMGLILLAAIFLSLLTAYLILYVIVNYGTLTPILALLGLTLFWLLYKKYKKREIKPPK